MRNNPAFWFLILFSLSSSITTAKTFDYLTYTPDSNVFSPSTFPVLKNTDKQVFSAFGGYHGTLCGPSTRHNTIVCLHLRKKRFSDVREFPFPGTLNATPVFQDGAWILSSSEGFLFKIIADPMTHFPKLTNNWGNFWSTKEKDILGKLIPPSTTTSLKKAQAIPHSLTANLDGLVWSYFTSSSFVGRPLVSNGHIFVQSSYQYLYCFDWEDGRLLWTAQLAPSTTLNYLSLHMVLNSDAIITGTSEGKILSLSQQDGSTQWTNTPSPISQSQRKEKKLPLFDKFSSLTAPFSVENQNLFISNAESATQKIDLITQEQKWQYPAGSLVKPIVTDEHLIFSDPKNNIIVLDKKTGERISQSTCTDPSAFVTDYPLDNQKILFLTAQGHLFLYHVASNKLEPVHHFHQTVAGDLQQFSHHICFTTSFGNLNCISPGKS